MGYKNVKNDPEVQVFYFCTPSKRMIFSSMHPQRAYLFLTLYTKSTNAISGRYQNIFGNSVEKPQSSDTNTDQNVTIRENKGQNFNQKGVHVSLGQPGTCWTLVDILLAG